MEAHSESAGGSPSLGSLLKAVIEASGEGVVVFDEAGRVAYASESAHHLLEACAGPAATGDVKARLLERGGRRVSLRVGSQALGEAVFLGAPDGGSSLAARERRAILETLRATGGHLAAAAHNLGISRTTLWRRLKAYGVRREAEAPPHE